MSACTLGAPRRAWDSWRRGGPRDRAEGEQVARGAWTYRCARADSRGGAGTQPGRGQVGAGRTHLRGREGRFRGIKGERNRRSTTGRRERLRKGGGAPKSHFSPKERQTPPLHLMEMYICTPGRKKNARRRRKPQYGQESHLRTRVSAFSRLQGALGKKGS